MLLFKRILSFNKPAAVLGDKRAAKRYVVGPTFPFKPVVTLMAHDDEGNLMQEKMRAQAWAGHLANLSETGANIKLHASAVARRGEPCMFKLSIDGYRLEFPGTIAHFRAYQQYCTCGFHFEFPDVETRRAYLQLLEPVSIGASLAPVAQNRVAQDTSGLVKEQYDGESSSLLTVWRQPSSPGIYSFDFRMNAHGVRWSEGMTEVEPYGLSKLNLAGKKTNTPFVYLTESELEDVRWLFCLAVPNLAKDVPQDVRKFLATFVA